jgi:putative FmdB family regulatory protein
MPLYEFRCRDCDSEFELLVRSGVDPRCPSCGSGSLERLLSMFAVSSEGTQIRSRQLLGQAQRRKARENQKEREHYKTDHHDD